MKGVLLAALLLGGCLRPGPNLDLKASEGPSLTLVNYDTLSADYSDARMRLRLSDAGGETLWALEGRDLSALRSIRYPQLPATWQLLEAAKPLPPQGVVRWTLYIKGKWTTSAGFAEFALSNGRGALEGEAKLPPQHPSIQSQGADEPEQAPNDGGQ